MAFDGRKKFVVLGAFSLLHFLLAACTFNGLGVVLPYMVGELGWTWAAAGMGFTLLGVACGLSALSPALLIRRIGVARTQLIGGGVLALGFGCFAATQASTSYFLGAVLLGIGYSLCGTVPGVHVISSSFRRQSTAIGIYFTAGGLGAVAGPLLVYGTQELTSSWRLYWVGSAVAALLIAGFTAIATSASRAARSDAAIGGTVPDWQKVEGWSAKAALRTHQFYVVVAAYTAFLLINTTVHGFAVQHLTEAGLDIGLAAGAMSAIALIGAVGSAVAGMVGERVGARQLAMLSLAGNAVGTTALVFDGSWVAVAIFVVGLGVGFGFSYVSSTMLLLEFFGKRANLELYSVKCLFSTVAAAGPALGGVVRDRTGSFDAVFLGCAAVGFVLMLALLWVRRPVESAEPEALPVATPALVPHYG